MRLLCILLLTVAWSLEATAGRLTDTLAKRGELKIAAESCTQIEDTLGQLFLIFTDGRGSRPPAAIHPLYMQAIEEMRIGAVRLYSDGQGDEKKTSEMVRESVRKLRAMPGLPILTTIDNGWVGGHLMGLGTYRGIIGDLGGQISPACFSVLSEYEAFLHQYLGVNLALGPTVDSRDRKRDIPGWWGYLENATPEQVKNLASPLLGSFRDYGVRTTLKHFPYTPTHMDLHYQNKNVRESRQEVERMTRTFKLLNEIEPKPDFVMTTHLLNRNIDSVPASVSKKWITMLREQIGFRGLIVGDGIHMLNVMSAEDKRTILRDWPSSEAGGVNDTDSIFSALMILAGHDIIIIDDDLATTRKVFRNIHKVACQNSPLAERLRGRIAESYARIRAYKEKNRAELNFRLDPIPKELAHGVAKISYEVVRDRKAACDKTRDIQKYLDAIRKYRPSAKVALDAAPPTEAPKAVRPAQ